MKTQTDALKSERLARGLTQRKLASRAKVTRNTVQNMERGESNRMATIEKVADALGVRFLDIAVAEDDIERQALARIRELEEAS